MSLRSRRKSRELDVKEDDFEQKKRSHRNKEELQVIVVLPELPEEDVLIEVDEILRDTVTHLEATPLPEDEVIQMLPQEVWSLIFRRLNIYNGLQCLSGVCRSWASLVESDQSMWKDLSRQHLGELVDHMEWRPESWRSFFLKRKDQEMSPSCLIQETYRREPWKTLIAVILCQRTRGGEPVQKVVREFFKYYPTPTHMVEGDAEVMKVMIKTLGMQQNRIKAVKRCCEGFVTTEWEEAIELFGVGQLGHDSFRLVCKDRLDFTPGDPCLQNYKRWRLSTLPSQTQ
ncbi:methyl-CpG-binding domain protein 4-like [Planoprotostelium fungivorum]|uniref:Methyl-CpG-binding domain protein 4-like n=1 Tax=Planoprotostelium fungivorum TaxID=1890364 RepID=A0A2P6MRJ5_9EUKA|nr:methyl-CpG-binding domain protein 4-like [Planoprotostelium fungivorum]